MKSIALHFLFSVGGLTAISALAASLGALEPFWREGKGFLVLLFGVPVLMGGTLCFWLLQKRSADGIPRGSTVPAGTFAIAGFANGVALIPIFALIAVVYAQATTLTMAATITILVISSLICSLGSWILFRLLVRRRGPERD